MKKFIPLLLMPLVPFVFAAGWHISPEWIAKDIWVFSGTITVGVLFALFMNNAFE